MCNGRRVGSDVQLSCESRIGGLHRQLLHHGHRARGGENHGPLRGGFAVHLDGIIGVVLAGISIGAYIGGLLADRYPTPTLGSLLFLSGLAALSISPLTVFVAAIAVQTTLMVRILLITAFIFFVPRASSAYTPPVVVQLTLHRLGTTGNVVGRIYAFSTLGSILGTFATGFYLISWMGTRNILLLMALILIVSSPFFGGAFLKRRVLMALFPVLFVSRPFTGRPSPSTGMKTLTISRKPIISPSRSRKSRRTGKNWKP